MGWRYRKSMKLMPGVRLNFGLHGVSVSTGIKGFRTTYSSSGRVTRTISIPGTGLSYVTTNSIHPRNQVGLASQGLTEAEVRRRANAEFDQRLRMEEADAQKREAQLEAQNQQRSSLEKYIQNIYHIYDEKLDWKKILISDKPSETYSPEEWEYYRSKAEDVLNGNIDTYFELIDQLNPFNDLQEYGSEFDFGTDDPRMMAVRFRVNSINVKKNDSLLPEREKNQFLQDYVCGSAIRVAQDLFALLPLRHIIVEALDKNKLILSVDFDGKKFDKISFENADASDVIESFAHHMDFSPEKGFKEITPMD